ncbi:MAG: MGMT family protein [bacterium]|nr:MGMT family protein [bacterium]
MDFKDKVHKVVKKIPEGETFGYKDVAKRVGVPRAWRAVGSVLRKNYKIPRSLASRG